MKRAWRETPKQPSLRGGKHEIADLEEQTRRLRKISFYDLTGTSLLIKPLEKVKLGRVVSCTVEFGAGQ